MKTKVINEIKKGKYYYYELEDTLFFVEGGGQLKDEGTINGVEVLSCFEEDGHIYHQTTHPLTSTEVEVWIDENHRYISCQGHTAQHLLSAAIYELYGFPTISHHYNLEGSYIDVDTLALTELQLKEAEDWVNQKIREHHEIEILYPSKEELEKMPIHHSLKVDHDIRIVHIKDVEYNPCKGMHVSNTSEVQHVYILGTEIIKGATRIHYMFGEVANVHFHQYQQELKKISVEVSKPMNQSYDGILQLKQAKEKLERELSQMQDNYIELYVQSFKNQTWAMHECDLNNDLLNKLCLRLCEMDELTCYLITSKQIIAIAGKNAPKNAREMFDELKGHFVIRGGGNPKICRGTSENLDQIKNFVLSLKNS